jgi:hypothetical protein
MEVEFNAGLTANTPVSQSPIRRVPTQPAGNAMSFEYTQALEQTLKETPTVRPEAVNRATALLSDANYPSDEVLNRVATTLAQNIKGQSVD